MSETPSSSYSVNQPNSSESEQSLSTRHFNVTEPVVAKRICFYKSGDPQFNGIKMVINNRSYKTFDALLDSLSKRVPLPFGVRNISTPKGRHSITNLEDLEDGKSYICSHQRKMKPINLERASRKPLPWQISRPVSARRRAVQLARENEDGFGHRESKITTPKKMLVYKNGDVRLRRTIVLGKKNTQTFEAFLDYMSELMQYPVAKLYTTDGRKKGYWLGGDRLESCDQREAMRAEMGSSSRSQIFSVSSDKGSSNDNNSNDNNSDSSYVPDGHNSIGGNQIATGENLSVAQYEDDIEKSVHLNQDGSITVEMKVRFKIKEEETIKWTTTVSRAGLSDDKNATVCNSAMCAENCLSDVNASEHIKPKGAPFLESYNKEEGDSLQQFNAEVSDKESESDLINAACNICENNSADQDVSNVSEDDIRPRFYRPPTPGPRRVRQKKAVVESVTLVSKKEVQEKTIGQFSYSEEIQNGENKSEYCMVAHSSRKKSSVSNPKVSDINDDDLLKLSSESIKEEMLFKVSHKSHDLIETTNRKTLEVSDEDESVQNILEKSVVEQDKETSFITNKVHVTGKNHLVEHNLTKKTLKPICDVGTLEESAKDSGEKQTDSLIHANTTIVEEAKYSFKSEFHHDGKMHLLHEIHDNDKKMSEVNIQDNNVCQRKSEVAVQVDCTIVNEKMGIDVQNNCMSSMLLHELQSTLLGLQKEHSGCIGKACSLSDLSPTAFGSSSNVLLAWLLVLNLRESFIGTIKDDMQKTSCSCSEIFTQLQFLKQTTVIEKVDELKAAFSHFQQSTENNLLQFGRELKKQDPTCCHGNIPTAEIHNGIHLHENEKSVEPCIPKDSVNSEEALKLTGELKSCFDVQEDTETLDLGASKTQLDHQHASTNSDTCSLASGIEPPERNEEMPDSLYNKSQEKNTDTSFTNDESETSVEPDSTVHSVTSNDKNGILDQDTSDLEGEKDIIHVTADKSEDEKVDPKSACNDKKTNNQLKIVAETSVEYNKEDCSEQKDQEDAETCEETSERLSTVSPLSFCYESKQITECDMSEGEQKLQVEELEDKVCTDTSQLKKCLKSPATSDWSDYRPDTDESDYNFRASSDLTNGSGEEAVLEKHYNTGYVKRTIERLYGKVEASFKPDFHKGFPYMSKVLQKDTEEFHSAEVEKSIYFSQEPKTCFTEKVSHSSQSSQEFAVNINKGDTISRRENTSSPPPQPTLNREETSYTNDHSEESPKQHCQPTIQAKEDEGILIDKGKWLLKENHLIRRSPPERIGMYEPLQGKSLILLHVTLHVNAEIKPMFGK
ncbi:oxygen-regulated protein 1 [Limosa lapponica baueri]|uniref:Oxygen-regulated protein 1 n=1 Tax=Limosa lapponica baueri TaxID=1758121 RepID=A0A2I0TB49_LIMLA|nr:oxygen-regulated protein 1 [Limosa lapponica baueri]